MATKAATGLRVLVCALLLATTGCQRRAATAVGQPVAVSAPPATSSRYVTWARPALLRAEGCGDGRQAASAHLKQGLYLLDFGQPQTWYANGTQYGTYDFGDQNVSIQTITAGIQAWADGFRSCGVPWWKFWAPRPHATIAVGTSNDHGATTYSHGQAWGRMVNSLNVWLRQHGASGEISAAGASDMEVGWNTPTNTIDWVKGTTVPPSGPWAATSTTTAMTRETRRKPPALAAIPFR